MKHLCVVLISLLFTLLSSIAYAMIGGEAYNRDEEAPFHAMVGRCNAAVISPGVIITAAHCIHGQTSIKLASVGYEITYISDLTNMGMLYRLRSQWVSMIRESPFINRDVALVFYPHRHPSIKKYKISPIPIGERDIEGYDELWMYSRNTAYSDLLDRWKPLKARIEKRPLFAKKAQHERRWSRRYIMRRTSIFGCFLFPHISCFHPYNFEAPVVFCDGDSGTPILGYVGDGHTTPRRELAFVYTSGLGDEHTALLESAYSVHTLDTAKEINNISGYKNAEKYVSPCGKLMLSFSVASHKQWISKEIKQFNELYELHGDQLFTEGVAPQETYGLTNTHTKAEVVILEVNHALMIVMVQTHPITWKAYRIGPQQSHHLSTKYCKCISEKGIHEGNVLFLGRLWLPPL